MLGQAVTSIHDWLGEKEGNLKAYLVYDDHRRSAFLDYALPSMPSLQDVAQATWASSRLWPAGPFQTQAAGAEGHNGAGLSTAMVRQLPGGQIRKVIRMDGARPRVECQYELEGLTVPVVVLEFNVAVRDDRYLRPGVRQRLHATQFDVREAAVGVSLSLLVDPPATLVYFPIETVSESEGGLERTYQGLCLLCCWSLDDAMTGGAFRNGAPRVAMGERPFSPTDPRHRWTAQVQMIVG
jgi:alpha-amylase